MLILKRYKPEVIEFEIITPDGKTVTIRNYYCDMIIPDVGDTFVIDGVIYRVVQNRMNYDNGVQTIYGVRP